MKRFYAGLAGLFVGPAVAVAVSGCGVGNAINGLTTRAFNPISLVSGSPITAGIGASPADNSVQPANASLSASTVQGIETTLSKGNIVSIDPQLAVTIPGAAGRQSVTGTHVGIIATSQSLSDSQAWSIINGTGSRNLVQGALTGSITFTVPGAYVFGPSNPGTPGVTYAGDLSTLSGIPSTVHVTGFDGGNPQQLGTDFQTLVQQAQGQSVNVYVLAYSDAGVTGNVTVNGMSISGQAHYNL